MVQQVWLVMADLIGSRKLADRKLFETGLDKIITQLNDRFRTSLLKPIYRWKGIDELAFEASTAAIATQVMLALNLQVMPAQYRFVLRAEKVFVPQMAGEGFVDMVQESSERYMESAAATLTALKQENAWAVVFGGSEVLDTALQTQLNMLHLLLHQLSERQQVLWRWLHVHQGQAALAQAMGMTQQAVSKMLSTMEAERLLALEKSLLHWVEQAYEKTETA